MKTIQAVVVLCRETIIGSPMCVAMPAAALALALDSAVKR